MYGATSHEQETEQAIHHQAANRKYYLSHREKVIARVNEWQKAHLSKHAEYVKNYREQHPETEIAHHLVHTAIRRGNLVRQPCEVCDGFYAQAHHDDYSKPLEVRWLCKRHHFEICHSSVAHGSSH